MTVKNIGLFFPVHLTNLSLKEKIHRHFFERNRERIIDEGVCVWVETRTKSSRLFLWGRITRGTD